MGCCFSNEDESNSQLGEPGERTTLLGNPVSNNTNRTTYGGGDYTAEITSPYGQRGDEQSALNKILHQTASNVIDVSAMDSQLEQHEYLDRAKHYQQRLAVISTNRSSSWGQSKNRNIALLEDLPAPDKTLSEDPITAADCQLMQDSLNKVGDALKELKVTHREDLVVQFGIP